MEALKNDRCCLKPTASVFENSVRPRENGNLQVTVSQLDTPQESARHCTSSYLISSIHLHLLQLSNMSPFLFNPFPLSASASAWVPCSLHTQTHCSASIFPLPVFQLTWETQKSTGLQEMRASESLGKVGIDLFLLLQQAISKHISNFWTILWEVEDSKEYSARFHFLYEGFQSCSYIHLI